MKNAVVNIQFVMSVSMDEVMKAFNVIHSHASREEKEEACRWLSREPQTVFLTALEAFRRKAPSDVLLFFGNRLQEIIQSNLLNEENTRDCVAVLMDFLRTNDGTSHEMVLHCVIRCLADMIVLNLEFSLVSNFDRQLQIVFFRYIISECGATFLNWRHAQRAKKYIMSQIPLLCNLLNESELTSDWLCLFLEMYKFVGDCVVFHCFLPRLEEAARTLSFPGEVLRICSEVLETEDDDSDDWYQFSRAIMNIVMVSIEVCLSSEGTPGAYAYAIYFWDVIFNAPNCVTYLEKDPSSELGVILEKLIQHLEKMLSRDEMYLEFVSDATSFVMGLGIEGFEGYCANFLRILCRLVDMDPCYQSYHMQTAFRSAIEHQSRTFVEFLTVTERSSSFFFAIACAISSDEIRCKFMIPAAELLLHSPSQSSIFFFIQECGPKCPLELARALLELGFRASDPRIVNVVDAYSQTPEVRSLVLPYFDGLMKAAHMLSTGDLLRFLQAGFRIVDLLPENHQRALIELVFTIGKRFSEFSDFGRFLELVLVQLPPAAPSSFRCCVFDHLQNLIAPLQLTEDESLQTSVSILLYICLHHEYCTDLESIIRWICQILPRNPVLHHILIAKDFLVDRFPIDPIIEFIKRYDFTKDTRMCLGIFDLLNELCMRWAGFGQAFDVGFIASLICVDDEVCTSNTVQLVRHMLERGLPGELCMPIIRAGFSAMPHCSTGKRVVDIFMLAKEMAEHGLVTNDLIAEACFQGFRAYDGPEVRGIVQDILDGKADVIKRLIHLISSIRQA